MFTVESFPRTLYQYRMVLRVRVCGLFEISFYDYLELEIGGHTYLVWQLEVIELVCS